MKKLIFAIAFGLAVVACTPKNDNSASAGGAEAANTEAAAPKAAKDYLPTKAVKDSVSYLLGINFGSFLKNYDFGEDLNYSEIVKGMKEFVKAKGNQRDPEFEEQFRINPNQMNRIFDKFLADRKEYARLVNKDKEDKFLADNSKKEGMVVSSTGLQYRVVDPGNDVRASAVDTVWVHYKGTLLDGTVFDEVKPEDEAISFVLNRVIAGWTEGLTYVGEGGRIELYIPAALGYGDRGSQAIAPGSTLVFDVLLDKVGKFVAPAE